MKKSCFAKKSQRLDLYELSWCQNLHFLLFIIQIPKLFGRWIKYIFCKLKYKFTYTQSFWCIGFRKKDWSSHVHLFTFISLLLLYTLVMKISAFLSVSFVRVSFPSKLNRSGCCMKTFSCLTESSQVRGFGSVSQIVMAWNRVKFCSLPLSMAVCYWTVIQDYAMITCMLCSNESLFLFHVN